MKTKKVFELIDDVDDEHLTHSLKLKRSQDYVCGWIDSLERLKFVINKEEVKELMYDGKRRKISDIAEELNMPPREVQGIFSELDYENFWMSKTGCGKDVDCYGYPNKDGGWKCGDDYLKKEIILCKDCLPKPGGKKE